MARFRRLEAALAVVILAGCQLVAGLGDRSEATSADVDAGTGGSESAGAQPKAGAGVGGSDSGGKPGNAGATASQAGSGSDHATTGGQSNTAGGVPTSYAGTGSNDNGAGVGGEAGAASPPDNLIDDFEDENLSLANARGGVWYLFSDLTTGVLGPDPLVCSALSSAPAELGSFGLHITATGFGETGSGLGVDFRDQRKVFDASKYTGIRFWARSALGKNAKHHLQISDATTDKAGGKCNPAANAPSAQLCDNHFGSNLTFTTAWSQYSIRFDQLIQLPGWGNTATSLDQAHVYALQITAAPLAEVDLWVDQFEFF